ncbi:MAG: DNA-binding protein [Oscillospiraceae bacterium]|nr:DNA-binding protein [Oscillospiraceae bacterium]
MESYMSVKEASDKWKIGRRRIYTLCEQERIPGAIRFSYVWMIPADAQKPADARIKSGKYIKKEPDGETDENKTEKTK